MDVESPTASGGDVDRCLTTGTSMFLAAMGMMDSSGLDTCISMPPPPPVSTKATAASGPAAGLLSPTRHSLAGVSVTLSSPFREANIGVRDSAHSPGSKAPTSIARSRSNRMGVASISSPGGGISPQTYVAKDVASLPV